MDIDRFFGELKRRKVFRVAGVYAVSAFVMLQVADLAVEPLGLPDFTMPLLWILLLVGLPMALILAWAFEVTPDGVRRSDPLHRSEDSAAAPGEPAGKTPARPRTLRYMGLGVGLLVAGLGAYAYLGARTGVADDEPDAALRSLAVLPFDNLSADPQNAFFAAGIHEEVLTQLSKVAGLKVISRTSVLPYAEARRSIREIGRELGVRAVVEGSVQRYGDQIRVTAQLIDSATDEHLWAERYDRSVNDVFRIQTEIALAIVEALRATLTPDEQRRIEARPTESTEAYTYYLQALDHWRSGHISEERPWREMERLLGLAIERDPEFARAHARLSMVHSLFWWMGFEQRPERLRAAREAAERALALAPDLAEGHLALGTYHYWGSRDYEGALRELRRALASMPNSADVLQMMGNVYRRQGRWDEAIRAYERAAELDPRDLNTLGTLGQAYAAVYRYEEALETMDRLLTLEPDAAAWRMTRAFIRYEGFGDIAFLQATADSLAAQGNAAGIGSVVRSRYLARDFRGGIDWIEAADEEIHDVINVPVHLGYGYAGLGDSARARGYFDSAAALLESGIREDPDQVGAHRMLAAAYAHLGRREEAMAHARRAEELESLSPDAVRGAITVLWVAHVHTVLGDLEAAIAELERVVGRPAGPSSHELRGNPWWDPLRGHPRFQELMERARP